MLRSIGLLVSASLFIVGCGNSEHLAQQLKSIQHHPGMTDLSERTVHGVLGRGESVVAFQFKMPYKTSTLSDHYRSQVQKAGWQICADPDPRKWIEFGDASSGAEKTKAQLTIHFVREGFDGELRFEQERPKSETSPTTAGVGYLRVTTPAAASCSPKK